MSESMIDRVRIAINYRLRGSGVQIEDDVARAAIAAMREPLAEFVYLAEYHLWPNDRCETDSAEDVADMWRSMIDAALK